MLAIRAPDSRSAATATEQMKGKTVPSRAEAAAINGSVRNG
jgi:hypothetical protein